MITPPRSAALNGLRNNANATNDSAQINQFLGTPQFEAIYSGNKIVAPTGGTQLTWLPMPNSLDFAQPISMVGTTIGRVQLPLLPVGNGADVHVSLWPDNGSGAPNTSGNPISATRVPAEYLNTVAAADGLENATGPLTDEQSNVLAFTNSVTNSPWLSPAGGSAGNTTSAVICTCQNTMIFLGGVPPGGGLSESAVNSTTFSAGVLGQPLPQAPLPIGVAYGCASVVNDAMIVYAGGNDATSTITSAVWVASYDPGNSLVGSWSSAAALPQALYHPTSAAWGNYVYVVGGVTPGNVTLSSVYYANVVNGQLGAWQTAAALPVALCDAFVLAVQGWLLVIGGRTDVVTTSSLNGFYYAKINDDGSLGPWTTSTIPNADHAFASGWGAYATTNAAVQVSGDLAPTNALQSITVTADNGPASFWFVSQYAVAGDVPGLPISLGTGAWDVLSPLGYADIYQTSMATPMPYPSVPLPASGLTNGAKYHLVMQAVTSTSASDGVSLGTLDDTALPAVALQASRHGSSWSSIPSGYSVPLRVWDASANPGGSPVHAVLDQVDGVWQAWSTYFYNSTSLLTGVTEVVMQPNLALNSNPTFTSGVSPWVATNGVLTQSSAQTHGGFPFSGLMTPTGGFAQAYVSSELFPITQTPWGDAQWVSPAGFFWTPTTWANFSLSVNWFDSSKAYISTSSSTVSLTGATWTPVVNFFQPPGTAAYGAIVPTLGGSPASSQLLYMSNTLLALAPETVGTVTSAAVVEYGTGVWPPLGVTQLL